MSLDKLRFYTIRYSYLNYLCNRHSNVRLKKDRAYVGVVLKIKDIHYFAPLCSPKPKMKNWSSQKNDVFLINKGSLGFIDFANMIPVHSSNLFQTDIKNLKDEQYANLLNKQYFSINKNRETICKRAEQVYNLRIKNNPGFNYCLDFLELEKLYKSWNPRYK